MTHVLGRFASTHDLNSTSQWKGTRDARASRCSLESRRYPDGYWNVISPLNGATFTVTCALPLRTWTLPVLRAVIVLVEKL